MHPKLDELLALRDAEGSPDAASHVVQCARCAAELEELRAAAAALRALPAVGVDRDLWPEIRRQVVARRRRGRMARIAAAAAAVVAVVTTAMLLGPTSRPTGEADAGSAGAAVAELAAASRGLEATLRDPGLRHQVLSPRRAAVIADLEDRIAVVDMALVDSTAEPPGEHSVALWSYRVELLDALVAARTGNENQHGVGYAVFTSEGSPL